jgi:hypothetical protein
MVLYMCRKLREIETIVGTEGGEQVLILCTDGGVMYFETHVNTNSSNACSGGERGLLDTDMSTTATTAIERGQSQPAAVVAGVYGTTSGMVSEIDSLQYNPDINKAWCLKQISSPSLATSTTSRSGGDMVVFLQAIKLNEGGGGGYEIKITNLQGME